MKRRIEWEDGRIPGEFSPKDCCLIYQKGPDGAPNTTYLVTSETREREGLQELHYKVAICKYGSNHNQKLVLRDIAISNTGTPKREFLKVLREHVPPEDILWTFEGGLI